MAKSPGGVEVGRVSIRAVPDTSKFREEAKIKLEKAVKGLKIKIPVILDTEGIKAELKKIEVEAAKSKPKIDIEVDGDGAVREGRRVKNLIQKAVTSIKVLMTADLPASLAVIRAQTAIIQKSVQGYRIRIPMEIVGLTKWLAILTSVFGILLSIPHILGAIGGAVQVVGGLLALLPALAAGAAAGIATLVVGLQGFFAALGAAGDPAAFEEALKKLTPAAQESARALAEFREPLGEIREAVQEELFTGMKDEFLSLKQLLPPIKTGLTGIAGGIRDMVKDWIRMATTQQSIEDTGTILDNIKKGFQAARPAAANFGQALRDMTVVGSSFFESFGKSLTEITGKFADWAAKARETGEMQEWIARAIEKVKQFFRVLGNIVNVLKNISQGLRAGMGEDFLDMFERLTQNLEDFTGTKEFQENLEALGRVMREVIDIGTEVFKELVTTIGNVLKDATPFLLSFARGLGALIVGGLRVIGPLLQSMARWFSENKEVLAPLLVTVVAMVTALKLFVSAANGIKNVKNAIDTLKASAAIFGQVITSVKTMAKTIFLAALDIAKSCALMIRNFITTAAWAVRSAITTASIWIQQAAKSAAFTARYYAIMAGQAIASFVKMSVAATLHAGKIFVTWVATNARMIVTTAAQMAAMVIRWVAAWVAMSAAALANAARIALAWLIAMGPVALVIALIIAVVAIIILNWDELCNALRTAWDAVWKFVSDIITWIVDRFHEFIDGIGQLRDDISDALGKIVGFFKRMGEGIANTITGVIQWFQDLPGNIMEKLAGIGTWLLDAGKDLIRGMIDGIKAMASAIWDAAVGVVEDAMNALKDWLGIGSPSKLARKYGEWTGEGLMLGIQSMTSDVTHAAEGLASAVSGAFKGTENVGTEWAKNVEAAVPSALASLDKITDAAKLDASAEWKAELTAEDAAPLEDRILAAMAAGLTVEIDGDNVTKKVNKNNLTNRRR